MMRMIVSESKTNPSPCVPWHTAAIEEEQSLIASPEAAQEMKC